MYILKAESSFDSAHFLQGYEGKCGNIHGHRWRVIAQIGKEQLEEFGQERGMLIDFKTLKEDLKSETELLDHALIIEKGTLKESTLLALENEGFKIIALDFRPTAENISRYFWERLEEKGYPLKCIEVYETPDNCAAYQGGKIESQM